MKLCTELGFVLAGAARQTTAQAPPRGCCRRGSVAKSQAGSSEIAAEDAELIDGVWSIVDRAWRGQEGRSRWGEDAGTVPLSREVFWCFPHPQKRGISRGSGVLCPEPHQPHFCTRSYLFPTAQSGNQSCAAVHSVSRSCRPYFVCQKLQLTEKHTENLKTHAIGSAMARR